MARPLDQDTTRARGQHTTIRAHHDTHWGKVNPVTLMKGRCHRKQVFEPVKHERHLRDEKQGVHDGPKRVDELPARKYQQRRPGRPLRGDVRLQ